MALVTGLVGASDESQETSSHLRTGLAQLRKRFLGDSPSDGDDLDNHGHDVDEAFQLWVERFETAQQSLEDPRIENLKDRLRDSFNFDFEDFLNGNTRRRHLKGSHHHVREQKEK